MTAASTERDTLPQEVARAYFGDCPYQLSRLGEGMINATYLVTSEDKGPAVVQRLSHIFGAAVVRDFVVVTEHLHNEGWEVPRSVATQNNEPYVRDQGGGLWRAMTYIESEPVPDSKSVAETPGMFGAILANLHQSLATLDYGPEFAIPHFHDTPYYAARLREILPQLTNARAQILADKALQSYEDLPELPQTADQLIHGDPRTSNMLFRDGKPFTYIDFDTVMLGSTWLDIGDLLRSLSENMIQAGLDPATLKLERVIADYRNTAQIEVTEDEFARWSLTAASQIALELTMRFLIDVVDDSYFSWDEDRYSSRQEHNLDRAALQWHVAKTLIERFSNG